MYIPIKVINKLTPVKIIETPILRPPRLHLMHDFILSPLNVQKVVAGIRIVAG